MMIPTSTLIRLTTAWLVAASAACAAWAEDVTYPDDTRPASTNAPGRDYPRIDSQRRAYFRVNAPKAESVRVSLGNTDLTKDENGIWTGMTKPLDPGFHYYQLIIDGFAAADPDSESFFGVSNMRSGIEIPDEGADFYDVKDVPHGDVRVKWMHSNIGNAWRRSFIYTPPGYDENRDRLYPVLYLLHGAGEDEARLVNAGPLGLDPRQFNCGRAGSTDDRGDGKRRRQRAVCQATHARNSRRSTWQRPRFAVRADSAQ